MAAFSVAPAVAYSERDATLYTKSNVVVRNALVGLFKWGPVDVGVDLDGGEQELIKRFYKPTNENYIDHLIAIDYLNYSRALTVIRVEGTGALNAVSDAYGAAVLVKNKEVFDSNPGLVKTGCHFMARYAGELGDNLLVAVADSATFSTWEYRTNFEFAPEAGEYCIAVVDTSGSISGFEGAYGAKVSFDLSGEAVVSSNLQYKGYGDVAYTIGLSAEDILTAHAAALPASAKASVKQTVDEVKQRESWIVASVSGDDATLTNSSGSDYTISMEIGAVATGASAVIADGASKTVSVVLQELVDSINTVFPDANATLVDEGAGVYTVSYSREETGTVAVADFVASATFDAELTYGTETVTTAAVLPVFTMTYYEADGYLTGNFVTDEGVSSGLTISNQTILAQGSSGDVITGEKYELMSLVAGAKKSDGSNANFKEVANQGSNYIYFVGDVLTAGYYSLSGGLTDHETASRLGGYDLLNNSKRYLIKGIVDSCQSIAETQRAIDVCNARRDAVAIWAPTLDTILNNPGSEPESIIDYANQVARSTSYQFCVDNWAYFYDRYNDTYRWIPATGGTAGKRARNMQTNGSWVAFSYYNRGKYSNYNKLAWSAEDEQRGTLFQAAINSIIYEPGEGFVLMGTKTGLTRPSAFSRINVRDLFIMMEQDIAATAKYFLGENNDVYTRALFRTTVNPYLRNLKDRRGLIDFRLKVDETNNDAQVIAENQFVAGIFIKAPSVIDWIWLDFAALRADMSFDEVEGNVGIAQ